MTRLLIMGVAGAGKSTLGLALSQALGWRFLDADDVHTRAAKDKIARGIPLTEADRSKWLAAIKPIFFDTRASIVLACSALRAAHRHMLKPDHLVFLHIEPALAHQRLFERRGHFAGPNLVQSQFATLEEPSQGLKLDATMRTDLQVQTIMDSLSLNPS
ncbi:gluconokinase [Candidatus Phycosocius spiralis]|uniref:Gluconokinase n=1 Tax=Candidatus Phycosocius spiralis TaxID=2815099 RepID=A0ABQ4PTY1_9PROT|nr:gluconokinase, GntK/IdnK-type [Candidatus Phycosocius spiralis]GIU66436.1 gluconokinase [Candidatus Phycosocius spiralis]